MTGRHTTHYLNSDFDLSLRPRPRQIDHPKLARQVRELSVQALLGASAGDSVLVRADVPSEFLDHLDESGLPVPRLLRHGAVDAAARFRPFGWSAEAIELNQQHLQPSPHPPLPCVRRVNSRSFALELEAELAPEAAAGAVVHSPAELESFLAHAPAESEWVVKAEHGNAGLANRRLRGPGLTATDRRFVDERLAEDDRLIVERWLARERDWCVVFDVPFDRSTLRVHETICTSDGALIGALFEPGGADLGTWSESIGETARVIASKLDDEGYFGPVCVDAFGWKDGKRSRLRPLADLNCRLSMSDGAHRAWRQLAPERTLYYRFFSRRKLSLPTDLEPALAALGPQCYDHSRRRGILLASPLELGDGGERWRPGKLAVLMVAHDRSEVFRLERWIRERFEA